MSWHPLKGRSSSLDDRRGRSTGRRVSASRRSSRASADEGTFKGQSQERPSLTTTMTVLSVFRALSGPASRVGPGGQWVQRRGAGHAKMMIIKPGEFQWRKFKDLFHMYTMVGLIPLIAMSAYFNITEGQAELAEIPEGYNPEYWEYESSPVTRFLFKHVFFKSPQELYELRMYALNAEQERVMTDRIVDRVYNVMRARNDYQAWYYSPLFSKDQKRMREEFRKMEDRVGIKDHASAPLSTLSDPRR